MLETIFKLVNKTNSLQDISEEAISLAKENNIIILIAYNDFNFYAYGAACHLTNLFEYVTGNKGTDFKNIDDKVLEEEALILELKMYSYGHIFNKKDVLPFYNPLKLGHTIFTVKPNIKSKQFIIYEDDIDKKVLSTGLIIQLPIN